LWPNIEFVAEGDFWDKQGIDAHIDGDSIQIKYDRRIATSGNLYHEIYEKTAYKEFQNWRKSPGIAALYLFITETDSHIVGYKVAVNTLAEKEVNQRLIAISPNGGDRTSMGFLIPLDAISKRCEVRRIPKPPTA